MQTSRFTAGALLALTAWLSVAASAPAQDAFAPPTYARLRSGAEDWHARGGFRYGYGGHGYGYFQPYVSPIIAGSWYARPHPHHFDYFRGRWSGPAALSDPCPCAEAPSEAATQNIEPTNP